MVSEAMLQQTQVTTVIPYFERFMARFPTLPTLAEAGEQDVLLLWQGLGYYSRARNLHRAAGVIVDRHGGRPPRAVEELLQLPGVGRYTAGAIASIAYGVRAPIVDGNVARVLCRLDAIREDPRRPAVREALWRRAEELVPIRRAGDFNSALMELGALVCTPRNPKCQTCPVAACCQSRQAGLVDQIPAPRPVKTRPIIRRWVFAVEQNGRWLMEQRPPTGRWANLWQFVTVPRESELLPPPAAVVATIGIAVKKCRILGSFDHALTHRQYEFTAVRCEVKKVTSNGAAAISIDTARPRRWAMHVELKDLPMSRPQTRVAEMLDDADGQM